MNTPLNLIIHRGSDQIGGMCVEISHSDTRVIVDAGTPLPDLDSGDEPVPGEEILPAVRGLFDSDSRAVSALLLSHSHGDHSGLLHRVLPSIPVHLSKGASQMLMAASIYARGKRLQQPEKAFTHGRAFDIGRLRITPFIVDHSTFGASAFVIEGGGRRVIYSGDLRMHGPHQRQMRRMLEHPLWQRPDALLMEGTLLGRESVGEQSEDSLLTVLRDDLAKCGGLALLMFSPQNVDRLRTMLAAARATDRLLVADAYTLFVLHCIWRQARLPNPFDPANGIRVWFPDGYQVFGKSKSLRNVAHRLPSISLTKDQILADPHRHALVFRTWMAGKFPELVATSRVAVFSYWSGYQDTKSTSLLRKQLKSKGVRWLHRHASGHIRHDDLLAFIRKVRPKTLIPMHTETGDQFVKYLPEQNVRRLNDSEVFEF